MEPELKDVIAKAHHLVEIKENKKRITQVEMSERIGVSHRTYLEYQRGTNAPLGMKAMLNLLNLLDDAEIVRVVREWDINKTSVLPFEASKNGQEKHND